MKKIQQFALIALLAIIPVLCVWLPFILKTKTIWNIPLPTNGMEAIVSNYDGPLYIVVAKTLYNAASIKMFPFTLPTEYYAAHFPLYPLFIRLIGPIFGFPYASLILTVASSVFALWFFNKFISQYVSTKEALWITAIFSIFPARWLIVRSVASPEPLFIGAIIASMYYFQNKKYFLAACFGAIAQITKSPAILLFAAYGVSITVPIIQKYIFGKLRTISLLPARSLFIGIIPFALLCVFFLYQSTMGNFFAYFQSGDNIHLFFPPFQIFNYSQPWVGTHWLEDVIFLYLLAASGILLLAKLKEKTPFYFSLLFFTSLIFVSHRDISRYALPIIPFLFAGYAPFLVKKEFKAVMALIIIPIYLYSLVFIANNMMSIPNWGPLL
jgi:Gpi18-like mannosyltransferase